MIHEDITGRSGVLEHPITSLGCGDRIIISNHTKDIFRHDTCGLIEISMSFLIMFR